ncbi:MAG: hypothetical protein CND26_02665 [Bacteroidetes bacterium MED-G13]|nr:MAG: hypothetical protein CND26_02665 [Bacteroidetes bacterium MED-G13]
MNKKINNINLRCLFRHSLAILIFAVISVLYFFPLLEGKKILQNDIVQYSGMSKELRDYRLETSSDTYWTNSAFSGMPTYQLGAKYENNYIKKADLLIRFLPRPADYLFLYFLGFYVLMFSLKIEYRLAILGALSFGFSTYLLIIIGAGHNAKAHAISYMPFVLSGFIYIIRKKYFLGFLITTFFLGLQITSNHFQMTYYLMLLISVLGIWFLYKNLVNKDYKHILNSTSIVLVSSILALLMNASNLMATYEYTKYSTRGNASTLSINPDGSTKESSSGLNFEYITQWSYGFFETFNLFIPRIVGGGSSEELDKSSSFYKFLVGNGYNNIDALNIVKNSPTYWGNQPFVEAPAYIGIAVFFLFVFSVFLYRGKHLVWILSAIFLSLMLSYGKNLNFLTEFFINNIPFYNKFRAVASIQVILELCIPVLSIFGLQQLFDSSISNKKKFNALTYTFIFFIAILLALLAMMSSLKFSGVSDQILGEEIISALIEDRKSIYSSQLMRTFLYVVICSLILFLFIKNKLSKNFLIISLAFIILFDLISFSKVYINESNFTDKQYVDSPYKMDVIYNKIKNDQSDFRILDLTTSSTRPNYFFNSVLGYHAAKLGRYQEIIDFYLSKNNLNVLSMLNTKYILYNDSIGAKIFTNEMSSRSAWFVRENINVKNDNEEIVSLATLEFMNSSVSQKIEDKNYNNRTYNIELVEKKPNYLKYMAKTDEEGLVVFSEVYYPHGWVSLINGKLTDHFQVNYILRGMEIPEGEHVIEFIFDPDVVKTGSIVSLFGSIGFLLFFIFGIYIKLRY